MQLQDIRTKQLAELKAQLGQITELKSERDKAALDNTQLKQQKLKLESQAEQLTLQRDQLSQQKDQLTQQKNQLSQQLTVSNEQMQQLQQILASMKREQDAMQEQYDSLQIAYADRQAELENALNDINMSQEAMAILRGDYDQLKVKYDKLVRPARTPVGKYVVEVRYIKIDDAYKISWKTPDMASFAAITQRNLEEQLAVLKEKDPDKLYIKVIFPENSGLSYSEAWEFTSRLHKRFDYYFKEQ